MDSKVIEDIECDPAEEESIPVGVKNDPNLNESTVKPPDIHDAVAAAAGARQLLNREWVN